MQPTHSHICRLLALLLLAADARRPQHRARASVLPVEPGAVQFRAQAFNLLNQTNFGAPKADRSSGSFGLIRPAYAARQMQGSMKVVF